MKIRLSNTRSFLILIAMMTMLFITACSSNSSTKVDNNEEADGSSKTIKVGLSGTILTFDPQNNGSLGSPIMNIYDTLFRMNDKGEFLPHLVSEYKRTNDTTWEFTLNHGIKFHNGEELTSEDVKFTLDRVMNDESLLENSRFVTIKEVKVKDDFNFEIITNEPDPTLLNRLGMMGASILPKDYIDKNGIDYFLQHPIGSGPYQIKEYLVDNQLTLQKFNDYFRGDVSNWDEAVLRILPEAATRVNELLTGGVDFIQEVPPAEWTRINDNKGTKVIEADSSQVMSLIVNQNKQFPTSDPKVRQAIDYAIDNKAIVENLFQGNGTPTRTSIVPGTAGLNEDLYNTYRYDLEKSKQLLKEAGYDKGNPLELTFQVPQGRYLMDAELGQIIAGMLEEAGIKVNIQILENSKYVEIRNSGKNDALMLVGYGNSMFDPYLPLDSFHSERYPERLGYKNQKVDKLLDSAISNLNTAERMEQYKEIQQIVAEELPYIYLYQEQYYNAVNEKVEFNPPINKDILVEDMKKKE
ncbi:ABC transporter substrate-binding protein [Niallia nealsonii]|uniref:Peptide ABC transporter substrate-binding protein n=1 Tax=Niallia nealsonii TaxID=115979 RepID=A0A2N0Z781_9BACI|nr:ABC transporter substrate-binding protein [Niallia nealsonii]PKG25343.1 peptide ABC transporter substrate-binding protein [Niallia nealsonii]